MGGSGRTVIGALREAAWLHGDRARAYALILVVLYALAAVLYLALSHPPLDPLGKALGTDFASFWTASQLALSGRAPDAWSIPVHQAAQAALFGEKAGYAAFFYPPPFLLVCLPLALLPYSLSLGAWLVATGGAWIAVCRAWLADEKARVGRVWLPILAFPAVLINAGHGQNGFLTAALFGAAVLVRGRRPWLGGALFGTLIIKPHLAVLVPIFLLLARDWRGFLAAGLTAAGVCLASLAVFGPETWRAFLDASPLARLALEQDLVGYGKMQSVFAAARLLGAPLGLAWTVQGLAGVMAVVILWRARRAAPRDDLLNGAALVCATLLTTPFLLDYDLTLLGFPLAWLFVRAQAEGWRPWEKLIVGAAFVLPLVSRQLATLLHAPVAPLVFLGVALCILRRTKVERP